MVSVVPRQKKSIGLPWKTWMKASDPAPYKGYVIFLLTLYHLCCSGLEHCQRKMEDAYGSADVWWLVRRVLVWVMEVMGRNSAVMIMSSLTQVLVLLRGDVHCYFGHGEWDINKTTVG